MGMFDDIKYEAPCPICGKALTGWQSKDGDCTLSKLTPAELVAEAREFKAPDSSVDFYTSCNQCRTRIRVRVGR